LPFNPTNPFHSDSQELFTQSSTIDDKLSERAVHASSSSQLQVDNSSGIIKQPEEDIAIRIEQIKQKVQQLEELKK